MHQNIRRKFEQHILLQYLNAESGAGGNKRIICESAIY